jgi:hypothetical protein
MWLPLTTEDGHDAKEDGEALVLAWPKRGDGPSPPLEVAHGTEPPGVPAIHRQLPQPRADAKRGRGIVHIRVARAGPSRPGGLHGRVGP